MIYCWQVTCVVCLITAAVWESNVSLSGGGFLNFVALVSLIFCLVLFVFEIFRIHHRLINLLNIWATIVSKQTIPSRFLLDDVTVVVFFKEFFTFSFLTVSWLIAAIVAAAYGSKHPSIAASAVSLSCLRST